MITQLTALNKQKAVRSYRDDDKEYEDISRFSGENASDSGRVRRTVEVISIRKEMTRAYMLGRGSESSDGAKREWKLRVS